MSNSKNYFISLRDGFTLEKGQTVKITGNSIFGYIGFETVTGEVFLVRENKTGFSFQCRETGCIETVDLNDGKIELLENEAA